MRFDHAGMVIFAVAVVMGCSKQAVPPEKPVASVSAPIPVEPAKIDIETHEHHHAAPHGGTLVMLGDHAGHLEFVLDADAGTITMYALDGEAESAVRLNSFGIGLQISVADKPPVTLQLKPVENVLTGETGTSTSQYSDQSDELKGAARFTCVIPELAFRGMELENLSFAFPEGNE